MTEENYNYRTSQTLLRNQFPEMQGNIIPVDYERSSWKYMSYERNSSAEKLDAFKMGGAERSEYDTINPYLIGKDGGSAYGGKWRPHPNKPEDNRLIGTPGEIKVTYKKDGTKIETKIGADGRAVAEGTILTTRTHGRTATPTITRSLGTLHERESPIL